MDEIHLPDGKREYPTFSSGRSVGREGAGNTPSLCRGKKGDMFVVERT